MLHYLSQSNYQKPDQKEDLKRCTPNRGSSFKLWAKAVSLSITEAEIESIQEQAASRNKVRCKKEPRH